MSTTITIEVEGAVLSEELKDLLQMLTDEDKREVVKQTLVQLLKSKLERELFPRPDRFGHTPYPKDTEEFLRGLTAAAGKAMATEVANDEILNAVVETARQAVKDNMEDIAIKAVTAHLFQNLKQEQATGVAAMSQAGFATSMIEDLRSRLNQ